MSLDHILLGVSNLERGIAFVEERSGVRAVFGGVHPGRGTANALLSLGAQQYLEIIAPDPQQQRIVRYPQLPTLQEPRLIGWAVQSHDVGAVASKVSAGGLAFDGPTDGSRVRSDGKIVRWRILQLRDERGGLLPFFIEWNRESVHPSTDAPVGCCLERIFLESPNPEKLLEALEKLGVQAEVEHGEKVRLRVQITGPRGVLDMTS